MKKIIALAGRKKSGKTLVGDYLSLCGYNPASFATPVKDMLLSMGVPKTSLYGSDEQKSEIIPAFGVSGRYLMQTLGTDWGRLLVDEDLWVNAFFNQERHDYPIVIDDCRFPNEVREISKRGGLIIGIKRPGNNMDNHVSEAGVDSLAVDIWIQNTGTEQDLIDQVKKLL